MLTCSMGNYVFVQNSQTLAAFLYNDGVEIDFRGLKVRLISVSDKFLESGEKISYVHLTIFIDDKCIAENKQFPMGVITVGNDMKQFQLNISGATSLYEAILFNDDGSTEKFKPRDKAYFVISPFVPF